MNSIRYISCGTNWFYVQEGEVPIISYILYLNGRGW